MVTRAGTAAWSAAVTPLPGVAVNPTVSDWVGRSLLSIRRTVTGTLPPSATT